METFVWKKKMDKEGNSHLTEVEQKKLIQNRQAINSKDLEKVKEARMAREYERQIREADRAREAALGDNDIDAQRFKQWSEQEEEFHLQQARLRSVNDSLFQNFPRFHSSRARCIRAARRTRQDVIISGYLLCWFHGRCRA